MRMNTENMTPKSHAGPKTANLPDRTVAEIAWLYYIKGLTQGEIAKAKGLSRPTIISYLKFARERGLVSIRLDPAHMRSNDLAEALRDRFGLIGVHVVPSEGARGRDLTDRVSEVAAHILPSILSPNDELGVSWGETISILADHLPYVPVEGLVVRQLIGSMANPVLMTAESCTTEIARRLSGTCINMNAPAVCARSSTAAALREEPIIAEQLANLARCTKAVFSLSPCTPDNHAVLFKVTTPAEIADYKARGAVCILAGRFLDEAGKPVTGDLDDRLFAVGMDVLKTMEGFLVVADEAKAEAARAALRGGFAARLVLDDRLAERLLALG